MHSKKQKADLVLRGPECFRELMDAEVGATVKRARERDQRNSNLRRTKDKQEMWMIHQAAPGLVDDRPEVVARNRQAAARAEFNRMVNS